MAILPCGYCQLFVGSLTRQHRTTPPATRPRPQPSDLLALKPDTARAHHFLQVRVHAHVHAGARLAAPCMHKCMQARLQTVVGSEQCRAFKASRSEG